MQRRALIITLLTLLMFWNWPAYSEPSSKPIRVALVLGSGGARGYAHVGVIKVLEKAGIPIDLIVGASAGSIIGGLYADSRNTAELEKTMLSSHLNSFVDINLTPGKGGVITGSQEQRFLRDHTRARDFNDLKIKFVSVATNLQTGEAVSLQTGPLIPAICASTALPGLVRPVHLNGLTLIDGGVAEPVPVKVAERFHPEVIIAIDVSQPLPEQIPMSAYGIYTRAQSIMWRQLSAYSMSDADIIIQPAVGNIGTFKISQRAQLIKIGEQTATADLPKILQILKQKHIALVRTTRE